MTFFLSDRDPFMPEGSEVVTKIMVGTLLFAVAIAMPSFILHSLISCLPGVDHPKVMMSEIDAWKGRKLPTVLPVVLQSFINEILR